MGLAAAVIDGGLAALLELFAAGNESVPDIGTIPRAAVLALLFIAPAVVGAIGALSGARMLLIAAAVVGVMKSVLAFSGITLVFLIAVLLYLRAAAASPRAVPPRPVNAARWLLLTALAVPVALLLVLMAGVLVIPLIAAAAVVPAFLRRGEPWDRPITGLDFALGIVIVGLLLGSFLSISTWTGTACWVSRETPAGVITEQVPAPSDGSMTMSAGEVAAGCSTGVPTPQGVAVAGGMVLGALVLAAVTARVRRA